MERDTDLFPFVDPSVYVPYPCDPVGLGPRSATQPPLRLCVPSVEARRTLVGDLPSRPESPVYNPSPSL